MKLCTLQNFKQMLDGYAFDAEFMKEVYKIHSLDGDIFVFKGDLKTQIRRVAKTRKWKLRNLTVIHTTYRPQSKKALITGELCILATVKNPELLASMYNQLQKMKVFI